MRALISSRKLGAVVGLVVLLVLIGCSTQYRVDATTRYAEFDGEINQHARLIHAPAQRLFAIVTDQDRFQSILPEGTVLVHESAPPYQPGATVRMYINHIFKLTWQSRIEEVVPSRKIRLTFVDGFFAGGAEIWEFETADGGTRTTHTIIVDPQGFWRKVAWNLKVRLKHDKMVEQMLDNLELVANGQH